MDTPSASARPANAGLSSSGRLARSSSAGGSRQPSSDPGTAAASNGGGVSQLALLDAYSRQNHSAATRQQAGEATASGPEVDAEAASVTQDFQAMFASKANDQAAFHELMRQTYGDNYDYAAAETIRQQTLAGDFSWMPDVQVVDAADLIDQSGQQTSGTALGAYSADTDTIYISSDVIANDPDRALEIIAEEVGHALDVRLNASDTAGDEGDIFAQLLAGNELSQEELNALRAENDSGTIIIDGQAVEVEYGCNPVKAVVDVVTAPFKMVADAWDAIKDAVITLLNSPLFNALLAIAAFIPIPIVQLAVRIIQIAKAVYSVAQGIKHGSMAMVLGGIASVAGGVANVGGALGASQGFIDGATKVATWAGNAAKAYQALSQRDFAAALSLGSSAFRGSDLGNAFNVAGQAYGVAEAVDDGDVLGALQLGSSLVTDLNGGETPELLETLNEHAATVSGIVQAAESGNYDVAAQLLMQGYGGALGLNEVQQQRVTHIAGALEMAEGARDMIEDGNYAGAALALFASAEQFGVSDTARAHLESAATVVGQIAEVAMLVERGEYSAALALALGASVIDSDPSPQTQARIESLTSGIETVEQIVDAVESDNHAVALGLIAGAAGMPLSEQQQSTLASLETRIEAAQVLHQAVEESDVEGAIDALTVVTGVSLPQQLAVALDGVIDASEDVSALKDAFENHQYAIAADRAADLADQVNDAELASSLRSLATLLQLAGFQRDTAQTPLSATA